MVFRFTDEHDKELMREVIAQKPFEAKYGDSARVWAHVAERVTTAIKLVVQEKQVRDRVRLLQKNWRAGELVSALGSGIEETLDVVNEQSHYDTLPGLVRQYVLLEDAFKDSKKERSNKKKANDASATRCASEIVDEAIVRRALRREEHLSSSSSSDSDNSCTSTSTKASSKKSPAPKRKNAFQIEAARQAKRAREDMELRRQQFQQQMQAQRKQHEDRIILEREMQDKKMEFEQARALALERAEERAQQLREQADERNRQLIYECVKVLGEAFVNANKK